MKLIFATRPSALARWQTRWVMESLQTLYPGMTCVEKVITTQGDVNLDKPLPEIGGKGLFTQELETELLNGSVHCAVHSLKDLPVENTPGLVVGCVPERGEVRDVLVSHPRFTLETLPSGALVGTSSLRRSAQLLLLRPDLQTTSLRGNVDTRVRKALQGDYAAIVLAGAGLVRLGLDEHVTQWLPLEKFLPAPGQGALGVQCREGDLLTRKLLNTLEHRTTRLAITAERMFLQQLGGGCSLPVAAFAHPVNQVLELSGLVASADGKQTIRLIARGDDPEELGSRVAKEALEMGAAKILDLMVDPG